MKIFFKLIPVLLIVAAVSASCKKDKNNSEEPDWPSDSIRIVRQDLSFPWEILWGKDDHIWMTERNGKISRIDPKTGATAFSSVLSDVVSTGEGGLLGMAQHPDFTTNGYLYVVYNYQNSGSYREKLVRLTFDGTSLGNPKVLLDNIPAASIHNGSRLLIAGEDPKLYMSTGDANVASNAQNQSSLSGKVLRLNLDGTIPSDNPQSGNPYWSLGHRNIQGLVTGNNLVYASEHGPDVEDEVNSIEKGRNYGWPNVTGPCNGTETVFCGSANVREPIWSSGGSTVATSGMEYYGNNRISEWKNSLLVATLKDATLYHLKLSADGGSVTAVNKYFVGKWGRLRDVCVSPAGRVYLCTSNGGGNDKLIEIADPD